MSSGKIMRPILLKGHERPLTQVKYNREGDLIFSSAKDHHVCAWYSTNGERLGTYNGHKGSVWSVDVDSNTEYIITASADFSGKLWRAQTGECIFTWNFDAPVKRVEFSPDNKYVFFLTDHVMGQLGKILIFEIDLTKDANQKSEPILEIVNKGDALVKPTIATWAYSAKYILAGNADGSISKFDSKTGEELDRQTPFKKTITDIQTSSDRSYFIVASKDQTSKIFDVDTFEQLKEFESDAPVNAACITPVKDYIILGGGQDARDVTTTAGGEGKFDAKIFHKIFEEEIGRVKGHFGPVNCLATHPEGSSYVSGGEDGFIRLHHLPKSYFEFQYEVERTAEALQHQIAHNEDKEQVEA
jgi:translation initiation factor 3 subunit I